MIKKLTILGFAFLGISVFAQEQVEPQSVFTQELALNSTNETLRMPSLFELQSEENGLEVSAAPTYEVKLDFDKKELNDYHNKKEFAEAERNRNSKANRYNVSPFWVLSNGSGIGVCR